LAQNFLNKSHSQDKSCFVRVRSKLRFVRVVLPTEGSLHNHSSPMSGEDAQRAGEVSCWENWEDWEN
ncbi:MAG: hypothetical protein J6V28_04570, partial [Tidjanibacter sp.]|nr:hypothetical protein [Tidjanibacter sp.]